MSWIDSFTTKWSICFCESLSLYDLFILVNLSPLLIHYKRWIFHFDSIITNLSCPYRLIYNGESFYYKRVVSFLNLYISKTIRCLHRIFLYHKINLHVRISYIEVITYCFWMLSSLMISQKSWIDSFQSFWQNLPH